MAFGSWRLPSGLNTVAVKGRLVLSSCLQVTADVSHNVMPVQSQQQVTAASYSSGYSSEWSSTPANLFAEATQLLC